MTGAVVVASRDNFAVLPSGSVGDGVTDYTSAIQAAIDAAAAAGGGYVELGRGTFIAGALTLKDRVVIRGQGPQATTLKCKSGTNGHFITSVNFSTLQAATNKWLNSDGVPTFIGLVDLQIDGNKANQSAGDAVRLYAKGLILGHIVIRDAYANGIYSEAGDVAGQTDWYDLPEGNCGPIAIRNCGSVGWHMRGPHDIALPQLTINASGGDGLLIERSAGVYNGHPDISLLHTYANTGYGLQANTEFHCHHLISESNSKEGLYLNGATSVQIGKLELYDNCQSSGSYQLLDTSASSHCTVGLCKITQPHAAGIGAMSINGDHQLIAGIQIFGTDATSTATAINLAGTAQFCHLQGTVKDFSAAGGTGFALGAAQHCTVDLSIRNCKTLVAFGTGGVCNDLRLRGSASATQSVYSGSLGATDKCGYSWADASGNNVSVRYNEPVTLMAGAAASNSHTGDTNEFTFATTTLPANMLGTKGEIISTTLWTATNNANNKTVNNKYNTSNYLNRTSASWASQSNRTTIRNRGAANSQISFFNGGGSSGGWGDNANANTTGSVDSTAAQTFSITGQLASSGDTLTLEAYRVEVIWRP